MKTCYELLNVAPNAMPLEVDAAFRQTVAAYRPVASAEDLFADQRFAAILNAYLTLQDDHRIKYDIYLRTVSKPAEVVNPTPMSDLTPTQRRLYMARISMWRRENAGTLHMLRTLLEKEPELAEGWALLGEFYFIVERLDEGIQAYNHAVTAAPKHAKYQARLKHALDAKAGRVELQIEPDPREELLRIARRKRMRVMLTLSGIGVAIMIAAVLLTRTSADLASGALYIPWRAVFLQCLGVFFFMLGMAHGFLVQPFERVMINAAMTAVAKGSTRSYPYGLLLLVTAAPSMWLSVGTLGILAFMDDEFPSSPAIMLGICILANAALTFMVYLIAPDHWTGTAAMGGNLLVIAAMLGWWVGSWNAPPYA